MDSLDEGFRPDLATSPPLPCLAPIGHVMAGGSGPSSPLGRAALLCKTILLSDSTLFESKFFPQSRAD